MKIIVLPCIPFWQPWMYLSSFFVFLSIHRFLWQFWPSWKLIRQMFKRGYRCFRLRLSPVFATVLFPVDFSWLFNVKCFSLDMMTYSDLWIYTNHFISDNVITLLLHLISFGVTGWVFAQTIQVGTLISCPRKEEKKKDWSWELSWKGSVLTNVGIIEVYIHIHVCIHGYVYPHTYTDMYMYIHVYTDMWVMLLHSLFIHLHYMFWLYVKLQICLVMCGKLVRNN